MDEEQLQRMGLGGNDEVQTSPLSAYTILLSLSAQFNTLGRWIISNEAALDEYGSFYAASDCLAASDILLEVLRQWEDILRTMDVSMPDGIGYVRSHRAGGKMQ